MVLIADNFEEHMSAIEREQTELVFPLLGPQLEDLIRDDLINLGPPDGENLEDLEGENVSARIIKHLGEGFYLSLHTQRQECLTRMREFHWKESETIREFNSRFLQHMTKCVKFNLFDTPIMQTEQYLQVLSRARLEKQTLTTALDNVPKDPPLPLKSTMKKIAETIFGRNKDGRLSLDLNQTVLSTSSSTIATSSIQPTSVTSAHFVRRGGHTFPSRRSSGTILGHQG